MTKVVTKQVANFHEAIQLSAYFAAEHNVTTVYQDHVGPLSVMMPYAEYARLKRLESPPVGRTNARSA